MLKRTEKQDYTKKNTKPGNNQKNPTQLTREGSSVCQVLHKAQQDNVPHNTEGTNCVLFGTTMCLQ